MPTNDDPIAVKFTADIGPLQDKMAELVRGIEQQLASLKASFKIASAELKIAPHTDPSAVNGLRELKTNIGYQIDTISAYLTRISLEYDQAASRIAAAQAIIAAAPTTTPEGGYGPIQQTPQVVEAQRTVQNNRQLQQQLSERASRLQQYSTASAAAPGVIQPIPAAGPVKEEPGRAQSAESEERTAEITAKKEAELFAQTAAVKTETLKESLPIVQQTNAQEEELIRQSEAKRKAAAIETGEVVKSTAQQGADSVRQAIAGQNNAIEDGARASKTATAEYASQSQAAQQSAQAQTQGSEKVASATQQSLASVKAEYKATGEQIDVLEQKLASVAQTVPAHLAGQISAPEVAQLEEARIKQDALRASSKELEAQLKAMQSAEQLAARQAQTLGAIEQEAAEKVSTSASEMQTVYVKALTEMRVANSAFTAGQKVLGPIVDTNPEAKVAMDSLADSMIAASAVADDLKGKVQQLTEAEVASAAEADTTAQGFRNVAEAEAMVARSSGNLAQIQREVTEGVDLSSSALQGKLVRANTEASAAVNALGQAQKTLTPLNTQESVAALRLLEQNIVTTRGFVDELKARIELLARAESEATNATVAETRAMVELAISENGSAVAALEAAEAQDRMGSSARGASGAIVGGAAKARTELGALTGSVGSVEMGFARLLGASKTLGPILDAAFPVLGAIGMIEILVQMGGELGKLYERFVDLKDIQEEVEKVEERLGKGTEAAIERTQRLAAENLKFRGDEVGAAKLTAEAAENKKIDLSAWLSKSEIQKQFKDLPKELQDSFIEAFHDITPKELPAKIDEVKKKLQEASQAAQDLRRVQELVTANPEATGLEGIGLAAGVGKQQAGTQVFASLLKEISEESKAQQALVLEDQNKINTALTDQQIKDAESRIDRMKTTGADSKKAELSIWQGVLQTINGSAAQRKQVEDKIAALSVGSRKNMVEELRKADQEEFSDLQASHKLTLAEELDFWNKKLTAEMQYQDRRREIKRTIGGLDQRQDSEGERRRIQSETSIAGGMLGEDAKPDRQKQLDFWNQIANDAKVGSAEYLHAVEEAQKVGVEAIQQTEHELVKNDEDTFKALKGNHVVSLQEEESFWQGIANKAKAGSLEYEAALKQVEDTQAKILEQQQKIAALKEEDRKGQVEGQFRQQESVIRDASALQIKPEQLGRITGVALPPPVPQQQTTGQKVISDISGALGGGEGAEALKEQKLLTQIHQQEYQEAVAANQREQAIYAQNPEKLQELQNKAHSIEEKYNQQKIQDTTATVRAMQQQYMQFVQQVDQALISGVNQWISGQRSFAQSMAQVWNSIVMSVVQDIEKIGLKWLQQHVLMRLLGQVFNLQVNADQNTSEAARTAAHTTANTTIIAADTALSAGQITLATTTGTSIAAITATEAATEAAARVTAATGDAGLAAAGTFAWYSATDPPAAPAMAAAAFAEGLAWAGLAAFETGGIIPNTGVAMVHQGEAVIPRPLTQMLMGAANGNAYSDKGPIVPNSSAPLGPGGSTPSSGSTIQQIQQDNSQTKNSGDVHVHAPITVHGVSPTPDMKAALTEHADHIGRIVASQSKRFNR